jgi:hypothetical protein
MSTVRKITENLYTIIYPNKNIYQGEIIKSENNKVIPHGYGKLFTEKINYSGYWKNGLKNGKGLLTMKSLNKTEYNGEFKDDKRHGVCVEKSFVENKTIIYEGSYYNDFKHGSAIEYTDNQLEPDKIQKYDIKYNMGFTNSMKPYQYKKNNFIIEAFNHNKNIVGPATIIKKSSFPSKNSPFTEYIYYGEYNNQICGKGILKISNCNLITEFDGIFKPHQISNNHYNYALYEFNGTIKNINSSMSNKNVDYYNIFPEFSEFIKSLYFTKYQLLITGQFLIKFNPFSLKPYIYSYTTFLFDCHHLKNMNQELGKNIMLGKYFVNNDINDLISKIKKQETVKSKNNALSKLNEKVPTKISSNNSLDDSSDDSDDSSDDSDDSDDSDFSNSSSDSDRYDLSKRLLSLELKNSLTTTQKNDNLNKLVKNLEKHIRLISEKTNNEIIENIQNFNIIDFIKTFDNSLKIKIDFTIIDHEETNELVFLEEYPDILFGKKYYLDNENNKHLINIGFFSKQLSLYRHNCDCRVFRINFKYNKPNHCVILIQDHKGFLINFNIENDIYIDYKGESNDLEKNGKGIEYYSNNNIRYEGNFKHNIPFGEGSLYDTEGNLIYTGQFADGAPTFN